MRKGNEEFEQGELPQHEPHLKEIIEDEVIDHAHVLILEEFYFMERITEGITSLRHYKRSKIFLEPTTNKEEDQGLFSTCLKCQGRTHGIRLVQG